MSETGKPVVAAALCVLLGAGQAGWAEVPGTARPASPLTAQEKTLHALNRFSFGPRPGDEAAVSRVGVDRWFQAQLHPESIDDSALDQKMGMFPAMQLSQAELMRRFPSPQMIKQLQRNGGGLPSDPAERAIYADAEANYRDKLKNAGVNAAAVNGANQAKPTDGDMMMASAGATDTDAKTMAALLADTDDAPMQAPAPIERQTPGMMASADSAKKKAPVQRMEGDEVQAVLALAPDQRYAKMVAMNPEEMRSFRAGLKPVQKLMLVQGMSPEQVETVAAMQGPLRVVAAEALEARLVRDIDSKRQLQAVMSDFWLNHFSVYVKKNQNEPYLLPAYERETVLPNALGNFEQLLVATAKSPAMLVYLDNWQSIGPDSQAATRVKKFQQMRPNGKLAQALPKGINENYARELMELHTLGVGGGYTQKDVIEVAKCFTGWTIDKPYQGGSAGFVFEPNRHEPGSKTVLGHTIREDGVNEGLEVLHILATSPATAHFVSQKLAVRFVSDTPPAALVDRMAATFEKTGGDIKAVLTTMERSLEFWSPAVYRAKVKTPIEFLVSAVRASDVTVNNPLPLVQAMEKLGMPVFGMQTPNGYSWMSDEWVSSNALIGRMNFALVLSGDRLPGARTNWPGLLGEDDATPQTEKKLETLLLGQPAGEKTRETVLAQFSNPDVPKSAEQSFSAKPVGDTQADADGANGAMLLRANVARKKGGRAGDGLAEVNRPVTPLGTMAGLLLGSPDFQRR